MLIGVRYTDYSDRMEGIGFVGILLLSSNGLVDRQKRLVNYFHRFLLHNKFIHIYTYFLLYLLLFCTIMPFSVR